MVILSGPRQCGKPRLAVEAKLSNQDLSPSLKYLMERVPIPYAFQVHRSGRDEARERMVGKQRVISVSAARFLCKANSRTRNQ